MVQRYDARGTKSAFGGLVSYNDYLEEITKWEKAVKVQEDRIDVLKKMILEKDDEIRLWKKRYQQLDDYIEGCLV